MSSDAAKRAAARRAKIMARGNAGLAKLAQTARGEEANKLYGEEISAPAVSQSSADTSAPPSASAPHEGADATAPSSSAQASVQPTSSAQAPVQATVPASQQASQQTSQQASSTPSRPAGPDRTVSDSLSVPRSRPGWAADPAAASGAVTPSEQEDQMRQQMEAMMAMLGGGPNAGPGAGPGGGAAGPGAGAGEMPDMASMFAQMMQGMQGMGEGAADGGAPPNPFAMLQGLGAGGAGGPGGPLGGGPGGMPDFGAAFGAPALPPSKAARRFPLLHALVILALVAFIAYWWEPNLHMVRAGDLAARTAGDWARRWAGLAGDVGNTSMVEKLPVFWAFVTLEVLLFSTRVSFVRAGSGLHPLLANFLPMLPPAVQQLVRAGGRFLPALTQAYRDGCLFVFALGAAVVFAEWRARSDCAK